MENEEVSETGERQFIGLRNNYYLYIKFAIPEKYLVCFEKVGTIFMKILSCVSCGHAFVIE